MKLWTGLACAAALALATQAAGAPAPLTEDGLGPVHIGMTAPEAEHALGARLKIDYPNGPSCGGGRRADGRDPDISYLFDNGRLARIDIDPPDASHALHMTAAGIHAGSTEADVKKAYRRVITEPHPYTAPLGHYLRVYTRGKAAGFIFETDGKRVVEFRAGVYPALGYIEGCL
jgi:hypothetical protein